MRVEVEIDLDDVLEEIDNESLVEKIKERDIDVAELVDWDQINLVYVFEGISNKSLIEELKERGIDVAELVDSNEINLLVEAYRASKEAFDKLFSDFVYKYTGKIL